MIFLLNCRAQNNAIATKRFGGVYFKYLYQKERSLETVLMDFAVIVVRVDGNDVMWYFLSTICFCDDCDKNRMNELLSRIYCVDKDMMTSTGLAIMLNNEYPTKNEARNACKAYAKEQGFALSTVRSNALVVTMGCVHHGHPRNREEKAKRREKKDELFVESTSMQTGHPTEDSVSLLPKDIMPKRTRNKDSMRMNCPYFIKIRLRNAVWVVTEIYGGDPNKDGCPLHNHPYADDIYYYSQHRRLTEVSRTLALNMMETGATNNTIRDFLRERGEGATNKDIANLRQLAFNNNPARTIMRLINQLQCKEEQSYLCSQILYMKLYYGLPDLRIQAKYRTFEILRWFCLANDPIQGQTTLVRPEHAFMVSLLHKNRHVAESHSLTRSNVTNNSILVKTEQISRLLTAIVCITVLRSFQNTVMVKKFRVIMVEPTTMAA
ncbi:hypothetical protein F4703DRAFT_1797051 [Phycomyces blakesleeanus]